MYIKSTKKFDRMPCAHAQYFDTTTGGIDYSGHCAGLHGYSRSVAFEFSGIPDQNGWIVPFGGLKVVKAWLEYYFDHTAIIPADDPRKDQFIKASEQDKMFDLRILPYGVSMEMSSLFIWEHVNAYVMNTTDKRCFVSKVTVIEHEPNSGFLEANYQEALESYQKIYVFGGDYQLLPKKRYWDYVNPHNHLTADFMR